MDPVNLSAVFRTAQSQNDGAAILVMKKALDTFKQDGANMTQLLATMPQSAQPGLGENIDIRV